MMETGGACENIILVDDAALTQCETLLRANNLPEYPERRKKLAVAAFFSTLYLVCRRAASALFTLPRALCCFVSLSPSLQQEVYTFPDVAVCMQPYEGCLATNTTLCLEYNQFFLLNQYVSARSTHIQQHRERTTGQNCWGGRAYFSGEGWRAASVFSGRLRS